MLVQLTERESICSECQVRGQPGRGGFFTHSHQLCLIIQPFSIILLTCVVTTDHSRHPDQLAASDSTATTTNTASSSLQQHASICTTPILHTNKQFANTMASHGPSQHLGFIAFCKQRKEPTSVFHVLQNPEISVVLLRKRVSQTCTLISWKALSCLQLSMDMEFLFFMATQELLLCERWS